jgi:hypothetical protein
MSYQIAAALQASIYAHLTSFAALSGISVFDAIPGSAGTGTYILIGPETVIDKSDQTSGGAEHQFVISVISDASGFQAAKTVAASVSAALEDASLVLTTGRLVSLFFLKAVAKRLEEGEARRIDLTFRARVEV